MEHEVQMELPFITAYGPKKRVTVNTGSGSDVQQHMAQITDINFIMRKYKKTGLIDHVAKYSGSYGDFSAVQDLQSALEQVRKAEEMFMSLPAQVRRSFGNDPQEFLGALQDPTRIETFYELGLATRPKKAPAEAGEGSGAVSPSKGESPAPQGA